MRSNIHSGGDQYFLAERAIPFITWSVAWRARSGENTSCSRLGTRNEWRQADTLVSNRITRRHKKVFTSPTFLQISLLPLFPGMCCEWKRGLQTLLGSSRSRCSSTRRTALPRELGRCQCRESPKRCLQREGRCRDPKWLLQYRATACWKCRFWAENENKWH